MKVILEVLYALTDNYGLSIIFLSILINILILPFYYVAEHLKIQHKKKIEPLNSKIDLLKRNFKGQERHLYLQTLYKIYNYHPLSSIKASFGLLLQVPFFFAAFHFLGNYDSFNSNSFSVINDLGKPDELLFGFNLLPILMTLISLFSVYFYSINKLNSERYQLFALSAFFLVFLYFESSALLIYWTVNNLFSLANNWTEKNFDTKIVKHKLILILSRPAKILQQNKHIKFIINDVFCQAIILFFGLIFLYKAIPIAASDTGMYGADYTWVVINLILFFLLAITFALILHSFLNSKWREITMKLLAFGAFSGLFFSFIMPLEIGKITALAIPPFYRYEPILIKILELLILIPLLVFWFIIFKSTKKIIWITLLLSNIILTGQTLTAGFNPKNIDFMGYKESGDISKNEADNLYAFSNESNTLIIMLDEFQGNIFADIIEKHPEIKQQFSGFTYYPNTLSHGSSTWKSIGAIAGGSDFQMQYMPQKNYTYKKAKTNQNLIYTPKEIAYLKNMEMAEKYNHSYSIFMPSYVECKLFNSYKNSICSRKVFVNEELQAQKNKIYKPSSAYRTAKFFAELSLVISLPHQTKHRVGRYISGNYFEQYVSNINQYAQLQNLSDFANTSSDKKTLKFFANKINHPLWMLNKECKVVNQNFDDYQGFLNSGYCSLTLLNNFFNKLRLLEIYDKTKIIIVSDHGSNFINSKNYNIEPTAASALLLVKDFNQPDEFKISMQFMSNMDTYGIALSGASEGKNKQLDRIKTPKKNRSLIYIQEVSPDDSYNITEAYKVKDNMFNKNNWEKLNQDQIEQLIESQSGV